MFCNKCGKELLSGAVFCPSCGNKIRQMGESSMRQQEPLQHINPTSEKYLHQQPMMNNCNVVQEKKDEDGAPSLQDAVTNSLNNLKENIDFEEIKKTIKKKTSKINKKQIVMIMALLMVVIVVVAVLSNYFETSDIRKALKENNSAAVYYVYSSAYGDFDKIEKYDELIGKKIDEIIESLEDYDFENAVERTNDAVAEWQAEFGSLLTGNSGYSLWNSVSSSNSAKMEELEEKIMSKQNYCSGLYAIKNGNYEYAIECLSEVSEADDDIADVTELIDECTTSYIDTVLKEVELSLSNGDIAIGLSLLKEAIEYLENNNINSQEVEAKINEVKLSYAEEYMQKAETAFKNKDAGAAIGNIDVAIELQPDNNDYKVKRTTYEQYLPFALYEIDNMLKYEGSIRYLEAETANNGDIFKDVLRVGNGGVLEVQASATYVLAGKYDAITGSTFVSQEAKNDVQQFYFEAYGDGNLIYTSPKMTEGALPQDISFNVEGVQTLEIKFWGMRAEGWLSRVTMQFSELVAQKDFPIE